MTIVQWVNLEKDEAYAKDSDIGSVDRCGALSLKALFEKDGVPLNFTVRAVPSGGDNVEYNEEEQKRNPNFRMPTEVIGLGSEKEVLLEDSVKLPAAGGNKYKLEAKDANGTTVESVEVEAKRKLYYQVLTMDDANVPAYSLAFLEEHAKKHFIKLQKSGEEGSIPYFKTITEENQLLFAKKVFEAYSIDEPLKKVGVVAVFSDYIADPGVAEINQSYVVGASPLSGQCVPEDQTAVRLIIEPSALIVDCERYLWYGLDDTDDAAKKWMIRVEVTFTDAATDLSETHSIPSDNVSVREDIKGFSHGGHRVIKIARDDNINTLLAKVKGTFTLSLELQVEGSWTNGFSWQPWRDERRLITCARRVRWEDMEDHTNKYTWVHEVGHRFGMVAYGDREEIPHFEKLPDASPDFYSDATGVNYAGHRGPHCGKGAVYDSDDDSWSGKPECVMFGADGVGNYVVGPDGVEEYEESHAPDYYCEDCEPIVRKLDLSK